MTARTAYPDNPIMAGAWYAAVRWAAQEQDAVKAFEADTGRTFKVEDSTIESFVDWFNANVWGEDPFTSDGVEA
jgi:hypothetical protein